VVRVQGKTDVYVVLVDPEVSVSMASYKRNPNKIIAVKKSVTNMS